MTPQIDHLRKTSPLLWVSIHISGGLKKIDQQNMHFKSKPSHVTPQIDHLRKLSLVLRVSTHISGGFQGDEMGKLFIFWVNLGIWPLKSICPWKLRLLLRFSTHIYGVSKKIDQKTMHFKSKPIHMTPQINHLRKTSPVLRVSTHIYGVSKEIDGKMFIFWVNLGMWLLKSIVSENWGLFWGFQHTFMGFPRR